jgi:subtilase family serine protease
MPNTLFISTVMLSLLAGLFLIGSSQTAYAASHVSPNSAVSIHPQYIYAGKPQAGTTFSCQSNTAAVRCYGPAQIRTAYNIQSVLDKGITGKGRNIVIIDAFDAPTIREDLATFDKLFGLNDPQLNIYYPDGKTPFDYSDDNQVGWSGEITLDVEWAHAVAPDATIQLVLAKSNNDADILSATKYAVQHNLGDVISQSFGEGETCVDPKLLKQEHQLFFEASLKGITLFASAGDQGSAQPACDGSNNYFLSASSPATDPFVTSVGGTQLNADATTGEYKSEVVWNEPNYGSAGGGGYSTIYRTPFYQLGTQGIGKYRGGPDIAYNGAINGGVLTVWNPDGAGQAVYIFGGTSAGSPQWAGIAALGAQLAKHRLGLINPALYALGHSSLASKVFHDITVGDITYTYEDDNGNVITIQGFSAKKGWDAATGWGTPNVANLLPALIGQKLPPTSDLTKLK